MSKATKKLYTKAESVLSQAKLLLPTRSSIEWGNTIAARWRSDVFGGRLEPIENLSSIALNDLLEVDRQKDALVLNTKQFCAGFPANNALLWGARGTGKSSLIQAILNEFWPQGLRVVQVDKDDLADIASIASLLFKVNHKFLVVCDDLSFEENDSGYKLLKSALEGGMFSSTKNVLIYATSNRRHLITESMQDNLSSTQHQGELHESEAIEEKISLSDRFGLWLSFHGFKQDQYLKVVEYWLKHLASEHNMTIYWTQQLHREALTWALNRGTRNGRTANHFARHYIGKTLLEHFEQDN